MLRPREKAMSFERRGCSGEARLISMFLSMFLRTYDSRRAGATGRRK